MLALKINSSYKLQLPKKDRLAGTSKELGLWTAELFSLLLS